MATKNPYAVTLSDEKRADLTDRLVQEIRNGLQARALHMQDHGLIDFAYSLYEQQSQQGISRDTPRYGSADLTSPIGTENVDALAARAVKTIFTEPLWIAEGAGDDAKKAPAVEEFMQWRQEEIRLQKTMKRVFASSLVETGAIAEATEDAETVHRPEVIRALVLRDELGQVVLDPKTGKPQPLIGEDGLPVPAPDGTPETVDVKVVHSEQRRRGCTVRRRSMKDFLFLPAHADDDGDAWARAVRFYQTLDEVTRLAEDGRYVKDAVALLGEAHERDTRPEQERAGVTVEARHGYDKVEKELWRVQFWLDLGKGVCCYTAVVSEQHACIVSVQEDWLQRWRTVYFNPYPCPYSAWGYSMVLTKLLTTIEEHTAWRNMNADRDTLAANAPIKRLHGAQWDPNTQPFGAGRTIDVANMNEVAQFEFEGSPAQALNKEAACVADAQRIIGLNDIAVGQVSSKARTLGENELATRESFTRTDDPIGNLQESMEELGAVMHAIEVQALRDQAEEKPQGLRPPTHVAEAIQHRDASFQGQITADSVSGQFRFKPRGSVESADPNLRLQRMVQGVDWLAKLAAVNPQIALRLQSPQMGDALMQMFVTEYKPRDKQAFLQPVDPPMPMLPGAAVEGAAPDGGGGPDFGGHALVDQLLAQMPQGAPVQ